MALTVAPAVGYDSFVDVATADAYFTEQGYAAWAAATTAEKENALRVGTVYVFARNLMPSAISPTVNPRVETATMEAAKLSHTGALYKNGLSQAVIEKTVGPLTIRYANLQQGQAMNSFPYIDDLLYGLSYGMRGGGGSVTFERI